MRVRVNGEPTDLPAGTTVADVVAQRAAEQRRVAVARNGEVVPHGRWAGTALEPGDSVELLAPTAGG